MTSYFGSDPDDEPTPGYFEWEQWWMSLTEDERAHEIALMDRHVRETERNS